MVDAPLSPAELAALACWLDLVGDAAPVSALAARRLVATVRAREAETDAAFALLIADLTPDPMER